MGVISKLRGSNIFGSVGLIESNNKIAIDSMIKQRTVNLTAAQIKALYTTPITLVPAPGINKVNVVLEIFARLNFVTTQFTGTNSLEFRYATAGGSKVSADIDNSFVVMTKSGLEAVKAVTTYLDLTDYVNQPIIADFPNQNASQGLGNINVQVFYRTLSLSS